MTKPNRLALLLPLLVAGCHLTPTPAPTPVEGASCKDGCHHIFDDLDCGNHPIDVYVCQVDCEDSGKGDPECMAGATTCSQAEKFCG